MHHAPPPAYTHTCLSIRISTKSQVQVSGTASHTHDPHTHKIHIQTHRHLPPPRAPPSVSLLVRVFFIRVVRVTRVPVVPLKVHFFPVQAYHGLYCLITQCMQRVGSRVLVRLICQQTAQCLMLDLLKIRLKVNLQIPQSCWERCWVEWAAYLCINCDYGACMCVLSRSSHTAVTLMHGACHAAVTRPCIHQTLNLI